MSSVNSPGSAEIGKWHVYGTFMAEIDLRRRRYFRAIRRTGGTFIHHAARSRFTARRSPVTAAVARHGACLGAADAGDDAHR